MMREFVLFAVAFLALAGPLRAQSSSGPAGHPKSKTISLKPGKPSSERCRARNTSMRFALKRDVSFTPSSTNLASMWP